jgi:hypothetical protein
LVFSFGSSRFYFVLKHSLLSLWIVLKNVCKQLVVNPAKLIKSFKLSQFPEYHYWLNLSCQNEKYCKTKWHLAPDLTPLYKLRDHHFTLSAQTSQIMLILSQMWKIWCYTFSTTFKSKTLYFISFFKLVIEYSSNKKRPIKGGI